jgi:hypothetical protein
MLLRGSLHPFIVIARPMHPENGTMDRAIMMSAA